MEDFKVRLIEEKIQLQGRVDKLGEFLDKPPVTDMSIKHMTLLQTQFDYMVGYLDTLKRRIEDLDINEEEVLAYKKEQEDSNKQ